MGARKKLYRYEPDYAVPPGETLLETIEELDMSQSELAMRLDSSLKHINRIIHGHEPITYETAIGLEKVTHVPASFWLNREANYREQLVKIEERKRLQSDLEWLKSIPIRELYNRGILSKHKADVELLEEVLKFFGVRNIEAWKYYWDAFLGKVAAKKFKSLESPFNSLVTWLRLGELEARNIHCQPYEKKKFKESLTLIKKLTIKDPQEFIPEMQKLCSESGVVVVFVQEFQKVPWYGASWWITPEKAIIELCLRGKYEDFFWFCFFHEAAHILNDSKKEVFIQTDRSNEQKTNNNDHIDDPKEQKADRFAEDFLIPKEMIPKLRKVQNSDQIHDIARKLNISPGIVVGRYQWETKRWAAFNNIKKKFTWRS